MNVYWSKRRKNEIRYEDRVDVSCDGGWGGGEDGLHGAKARLFERKRDCTSFYSFRV